VGASAWSAGNDQSSPSPLWGGIEGGGRPRAQKRTVDIGRARSLRKRMPPAEAQLWDYPRVLKTDGFHFRRQVPLGRYYVDFACHHARLVIEVDGDSHYSDSAERYDSTREAFIRAQGYDVIRYTNDDVIQNLDGIATTLLAALANRKVGGSPTPTLDPSPQGGGRRLPDSLPHKNRS
jgi:very-short-patch-repair endonuclease